MTIPPSFKSRSFDVLTGFLGLVLLLVLDFRTNIKFDLRWVFIVGGSLCFVLGFLRGGRALCKPWLTALLTISGFSIPLLFLSFMGLAFGAKAVLLMFLVTSAILTFSGVQARQNWHDKKRIVSLTFLLLPLACLILASVLLLPPLMETLSGQRVNIPAPEVSLITEDHRSLTSAELKGKVVVLAFWATWCEPCWQELPRVEQVYASYQDDPRVVFWAVNAHAGGDTEEMARAFAKKMRLAIPVAFMENANAVRLGVDGYPMLILLDATGHVRFIHGGYDGSERLESNLAQEISSVLNQGT